MESGESPDPARHGRDGKEVVGSKGFDRSSSTSPRAGLSLKSRGSLPWGNRDRDYRLRSHWSKLPPVRSATRAQRKEQNQQLLGRCTKDGNSNTASLYKESETKMLLSVFVGLTTDLAFLQKTS